MSGQWPPEWGDAEWADPEWERPSWETPEWETSEWENPERGNPEPSFPRETAHRHDPGAGSRLSEVTAALAALPSPVLPDAFEARISAAIAAEADARAAGTGTAGAAESEPVSNEPVSNEPVGADSVSAGNVSDLAGGATSSGTPDSGDADSEASGGSGGVRSRVLGRGRARSRVRRNRRVRPVVAAGSALACLFLAIGGYALARLGSGSASQTSSAAAAAPAASAAGPDRKAFGASGVFGDEQPGHASQRTGTPAAGFAVIESGTEYSRSALASQVQRELTRYSIVPRPAATATGRATASPRGTATRRSNPAVSGKDAGVPLSALKACVLRITRGVRPSLVDRASYAGRAVYVIAVPDRVWVVGRGCTAAHPELIISVSLAS